MNGYWLFDTAIGRCGLAWSPRGIIAVQLPQRSDVHTVMRMQQRCGAIELSAPPPDVAQAIDAIVALLDGRLSDLAAIVLDLDDVPAFDRGVYEMARAIPPGRTSTYGDIAKHLGDIALSRDVGRALGRNPFTIVVPCHRVLAAGGKPGGFSAYGGVQTKLKMLAIEGAAVNHTPSLFNALQPAFPAAS